MQKMTQSSSQCKMKPLTQYMTQWEIKYQELSFNQELNDYKLKPG